MTCPSGAGDAEALSQGPDTAQGEALDAVLYRRDFQSVVLDPLTRTGTEGRVALRHGRRAWLIEREPTYWPLIEAAVDVAGQP